MTALEKVVYEEYGANAIVSTPNCVLWACDKLPSNLDPKKELEKINKKRKKYGQPHVYAPYGHVAF